MIRKASESPTRRLLAASGTYSDATPKTQTPRRAPCSTLKPGERIAVWAFRPARRIMIGIRRRLAGVVMVHRQPGFAANEGICAEAIPLGRRVRRHCLPRQSMWTQSKRRFCPALPRTSGDHVSTSGLFLTAFTHRRRDKRIAPSRGQPNDPVRIQYYLRHHSAFRKARWLHSSRPRKQTARQCRSMGIDRATIFITTIGRCFHTGGLRRCVLGTYHKGDDAGVAGGVEPVSCSSFRQISRQCGWSGVPTIWWEMLETRLFRIDRYFIGSRRSVPAVRPCRLALVTLLVANKWERP